MGSVEAERRHYLMSLRTGCWRSYLPVDAQCVAAVMTAGEDIQHASVVRLDSKGRVVLSSAHNMKTGGVIGLTVCPTLGVFLDEPVVVIMRGITDARIFSDGEPNIGDDLILSTVPGVLTSKPNAPDNLFQSGQILLEMGCIYETVDLSPSEKTYLVRCLFRIGSHVVL